MINRLGYRTNSSYAIISHLQLYHDFLPFPVAENYYISTQSKYVGDQHVLHSDADFEFQNREGTNWQKMIKIIFQIIPLIKKMFILIFNRYLFILKLLRRRSSIIIIYFKRHGMRIILENMFITYILILLRYGAWSWAEANTRTSDTTLLTYKNQPAVCLICWSDCSIFTIVLHARDYFLPRLYTVRCSFFLIFSR